MPASIANEAAIQEAIAAYHSKVAPTITCAAARYGVDKGTLSRRLRGQLSRDESDSLRQLLTPDQEELVYSICRDLGYQNMSCTNSDLRELAFQASGQKSYPSTRWLRNFKKRWPSLEISRTGLVPGLLLDVLTDGIVHDIFDYLEGLEHHHNITPDQIWNMDEHGYRHGHQEREYTVFDRYDAPPAVAQSNSTQWTSVIECISAVGRSIPPYVIHTGHHAWDTWLPASAAFEDHSDVDFGGWRWAFSTTGWSGDGLAIEWLANIFIPAVRPSIDRPAILLLDNHSTHTTGEFMTLAHFNHVLLVYLPPHSTHKLQPLDLGVFVGLKRMYCKTLEDRIGQRATNVNRKTFNLIYEAARRKAMTPAAITTGWKRTGLHPRNRSRILQDPGLVRKRQTSIDFAIPDRNTRLREISPIDQGIVQDLCRHPERVHASPQSTRTVRNLARAYLQSQAMASLVERQFNTEHSAARTTQGKKKMKKMKKTHIAKGRHDFMMEEVAAAVNEDTRPDRLLAALRGRIDSRE